MVLDKGRDRKDKDQFTAAWGSSQQQVWTSAESSGWSEWRGTGKREKREGSRSWWEERGWEGEGRGGQREGLRETYTHKHTEKETRDRHREREGREEACLPGGHRERIQFTIQADSKDGVSRTWAGCRKEIHMLPMFTQSDWGDRAVKSDHSERGQSYCRAEHGRCRGLERE